MCAHLPRASAMVLLAALASLLSCQVGDRPPSDDSSENPPAFGSFTLSGKSFAIPLSAIGTFEMADGGGASRAAVAVELFHDTPTDQPAGCTLFLETADVLLLPGRFDAVYRIDVYIAGASSMNPCVEGALAGQFAVHHNGAEEVLDVGEIAVPTALLADFCAGKFALCLEVSGEVEGTLDLAQIRVRFGAPADGVPGDDGSPPDLDPADQTYVQTVVEHTAALPALLEDLEGLAAEQGEAAAKQSIADRIALNAAVDWADVTTLGVVWEYKGGGRGGILLESGRVPPADEIGGEVAWAPAAWGAAGRAARVLAGARPRFDKAVYMQSAYTELAEWAGPLRTDMRKYLGQINIATMDEYTDTQCTIERYLNLDQYGIIYLGAHGWPFTSLATGEREIYMLTGHDWSEALMLRYLREFRDGKWMICFYRSRCGANQGQLFMRAGISGHWIAEENDFGPQASFLWLGFCYSWGNPWPSAILDTAHAAGMVGYDRLVWVTRDVGWARAMFAGTCDTTMWDPMTVTFWHENNDDGYTHIDTNGSKDPADWDVRRSTRRYRGTRNLAFWEKEASQPALVGTVPLPGAGWALHVVDGRAYVLDKTLGLTIVDVSNELAPSVLGSVDLGYRQSQSGRDVWTDGTYAYVAGGSFYIVDVSDAAAPRITVQSGLGMDCSGIAVAEGIGHAVVTGPFSYKDGGKLATVDITDPDDAFKTREVGGVEFGYKPYDVALTTGWDACVSDRDTAELYMVNFQVPSAPALTAGASGGKGSGRHKIRVAGDNAFIAPMNVYNVANPAAPRLTVAAETGYAHDIEIVGNRAYTVGPETLGSGFLHVYDITDPTAPVYLTQVITPGTGVAVDVVGRFAYVTLDHDGTSGSLAIVDLGG